MRKSTTESNVEKKEGRKEERQLTEIVRIKSRKDGVCVWVCYFCLMLVYGGAMAQWLGWRARDHRIAVSIFKVGVVFIG